ncbi:MAG TPA: TOBE domain-containing protein [Terriglobia bacterium]|nr:TOBE domain-containing protein [Terriglobia bacterium]
MRSGSGWLRQSAEELALKKGDAVTAVVKATEVMIPEE